MKTEMDENTMYVVSIMSVCFAIVVIIILTLSYYKGKAELMAEMVKGGQDPMRVRCALYLSCPTQLPYYPHVIPPTP